MTTKDEYIRKMHSRLDQINAELDRLLARKEAIGEASRAELHKRMEELRQHRDDVQGRVKSLQQASGNAWDDLKTGSELAWSAIVQAIESARSRFR